MSNYSKPITTMSGSNTITYIKTAIANVAQNIITPMSSSGYVYTPYVPLQTSDINNKETPLPNVTLHSIADTSKSYQFAIGKTYEFLFSYMKTAKQEDLNSNFSSGFNDEDFRKAIQRFVHTFKQHDKIFISGINQVCNRWYYVSEYSGNSNDDYCLMVISGDKMHTFTGTELVDMLDKNIIRELPLVSIGKLYDDR